MAHTSRPAPVADLISLPGIRVDDSACDVDDLAPCGGVTVTVPGELGWDELVALAVSSSWPGVEALSGVAGDVAEVVRADASSHGQSVADVVASVRTWDRSTDRQRTLAWGDCRFGTDTPTLAERLPDGRERYQILDVTLLFKQGDLTGPVRDEELAAMLDVAPGQRVPLSAVREVLVQA